MPHRETPLPALPEESPSRALAARVITGALAVFVPAMVAIIGYRSIMIHGPSTAVVIDGDPTLDGAKIEVVSSLEPHRRLNSTLNASNDWESPILLDPGLYHVTVTHLGKTILDEDLAPDRLHGVRDELRSMVTIIGNRTLADAKIEISKIHKDAHPMRPMPVKLSAESHYRTAVYLLAGEYRAVARAVGTGQLLAQVDFTIDHFDRTKPRISKIHVDLTKPPVDELDE
ncbi:MAG TPA: hypothetical protein VFE47_27005 [Tepidisphaeraceae bacterium]|jgi:hypothetical protein|nr:hypothetical protein [Tepidisphaeraceae bacterium]